MLTQLIIVRSDGKEAFRQPGPNVPKAIRRVLPDYTGEVLVSSDGGKTFEKWERKNDQWLTVVRTNIWAGEIGERRPRREVSGH